MHSEVRRIAHAAFLVLCLTFGTWTSALPQGTDRFDAEATKRVLEMAGERVLEGKPRTMLILVARLGTGETSEKLAQRRLEGLAGYLREHSFGNAPFPEERLVSAVGERATGLGRVELYVNGELYWTIMFNRGQGVDFRIDG